MTHIVIGPGQVYRRLRQKLEHHKETGDYSFSSTTCKAFEQKILLPIFFVEKNPTDFLIACLLSFSNAVIKLGQVVYAQPCKLTYKAFSMLLHCRKPSSNVCFHEKEDQILTSTLKANIG